MHPLFCFLLRFWRTGVFALLLSYFNLLMGAGSIHSYFFFEPFISLLISITFQLSTLPPFQPSNLRTFQLSNLPTFSASERDTADDSDGYGLVVFSAGNPVGHHAHDTHRFLIEGGFNSFKHLDMADLAIGMNNK